VLLLELDDDVARERMLKRAEVEGRADDTPEVIERRLATYHEQTEPVVEHYLGTGKLVKVHAERTIEEVWAEIQDALEMVSSRA
jgi:adenylate kinase